jgi:hypothetical protein
MTDDPISAPPRALLLAKELHAMSLAVPPYPLFAEVPDWIKKIWMAAADELEKSTETRLR